MGYPYNGVTYLEKIQGNKKLRRQIEDAYYTLLLKKCRDDKVDNIELSLEDRFKQLSGKRGKMKFRFIGESDVNFKHGEVYALSSVTYKNCCKGNLCAKCIWLQMDKRLAMPYSCFEAITKNWETVEDNLPDDWYGKKPERKAGA